MMNHFRFHTFVRVVALSALLSPTNDCLAHFPWLALDEQGHAMLFFSEGPAERDYHLPESVAAAEVLVHGEKAEAPQPVELVTVEEGEVVGRRSKDPLAPESTLSTSFTYGNYHGTLLKYYAQMLPPIGSDKGAAPIGGNARLSARTAPTKTGMEVTVQWDGKPLAGAGVTIIDAEGQQAEEKTDAQGRAAFSTQAEGLTGFVIAHVLKEKGEWEGKPHTSESHYATVTTHYKPQHSQRASTPKPKDEPKKRPAIDSTSRFAPLPTAVASFGAAVCDGWLYVYSGHTGKAHDHSRDNLSTKFVRLALDNPHAWKELPMQTPLQGLPLVAHNGKLYRVGGLSASNASGEDEDLHSVDEFACFDPQANSWSTLPNLPEGRSSHDAVVLGDVLYVVGGWKLDGGRNGEWLDTAWAFNLAEADAQWQTVPSPPFRRRALALAHWDGKVVVLCGMDEDHDISRTVDIFDPARGEWSQLVDFPGEGGMSGFGISAWNTGDKLYACGSEGVVYRLDDNGEAWTKIAELDQPRFFHRLLAHHDAELLAIGGAPLADEEHLNGIEAIDLNAK